MIGDSTFCMCHAYKRDHGSLLLRRTQTCITLQGGQLTPIDLIVEERFHRAAPGGMGGTKAAGNYSPVRLSAAFHHAVLCVRKGSSYISGTPP